MPDTPKTNNTFIYMVVIAIIIVVLLFYFDVIKFSSTSSSTKSLTASTLNITGDKLCIGSSCISETDLKLITSLTTSLTTSTLNITGNKLCIGSSCISEVDLKQILYGDDKICGYKPSQVFNITASNSFGKTFKNKFTKTSLPENERTTMPINWGTIETEIAPDYNAKIKQTVYDEFTNRVACRYSKNMIARGLPTDTPIFSDNNYNNIITANDVWGPFSTEECRVGN